MLAAGFVAAVWYANKPAPPKAAPTFTDHAVVDQAGYSSNGTLEQPSNTDVTQVQHARTPAPRPSCRATARLPGRGRQ